jgi:homoaconitate hydratase family protein
MSHDNTAFIVKKFRDAGFTDLWNPEKVVVVFDHCVPARTPAHLQNHDEARRFVREAGIRHFFDAGEGVSHQLMMERGFVLPGQLVVGADSHSTIYGALNAVGIPINRTEMAGVWAIGEIWFRVPNSIRVDLFGRLEPGVFAKDISLKILKILGGDGATYRCLEFAGSGLSHLSMSERMTLSNMAVEVGAKAGIMPFDSRTRDYLKGRTGEFYKPISADKTAEYEQNVRIDLSQLQPQVACPHRVDNIKDLADVVGTPIRHGYLGSCTNGRLDDLRIAADVLDGRKVADGVRLVVYPASEEVRRSAQAEGILTRLALSGAEIEVSACGSCFGAVGATLEPGDVCISSSNRNFCGRMGSRDAEIYLSSPAVVAASCLNGVITDPRETMQ